MDILLFKNKALKSRKVKVFFVGINKIFNKQRENVKII